MGNTGAYITFGILMVIFIPLIMGFVGSAFSDTIDSQSSFGDEGYTFLHSVADWMFNLSDIPIIGGFFSFVGNIFLGYDIFPVWVNIIIITIPALLITRGVASTSG